MDRCIHTMSRNDLTEIRFLHSVFKSKDYIDVRVWFRDTAASTEWKPTTKGVNFPLDLWPEFQKGITALTDYVESHKKQSAENPWHLHSVVIFCPRQMLGMAYQTRSWGTWTNRHSIPTKPCQMQPRQALLPKGEGACFLLFICSPLPVSSNRIKGAGP